MTELGMFYLTLTTIALHLLGSIAYLLWDESRSCILPPAFASAWAGALALTWVVLDTPLSWYIRG